MRTPMILVALAGLASISLAGPGDPRPQEAGAAAPQPRVRFDGHRTVRVTVQTPRELMTVLGLTDDVLTCEGAGIGTFDVRFSPEQFAAFAGTGIAHQVLIEDLQAHLDAWLADNQRIREQGARGGWYDVFRDFAEVNSRLDGLAAAHPAISTLSVIGQSLENRPIRMIRITGPGSTASRPAIFINGTQHSRESLSPMTTMYFLEHLLTGYGSDPRITDLVNGIDFHIVPVANPDGYEHVWNVNLMWRKNRRENIGSNCRGVDLNRNWSFQWGNSNGSSGDPCNETYRGTAGFSEPETTALATVIDQLATEGRFKVHMDIHSYATQLLSPWGYTTNPPPHLQMMHHLARTIRDNIVTHRGTNYQYGQGSVILYVVSGGSRDYSYGVHGAMGWTIELPGTSFHPPASEILPVAQETQLGLLALAETYLPVPSPGACCTISGCLVTSPAMCDANAGIYMGDGTSCGTVTCPGVLSATGATNAGINPSGGGVFMDLTAAANPLEVVRFDYVSGLAAGAPVSIEVWTRPGTYVGFHSSPAGWTLHDTVTVSGSNGTNLRTPLPLNVPLEIGAGETVGVYLIAQAGGIRYTSSGAQPTWSNTDLTLFSDRARTAPWSGTLVQTRTFSGSVFYRVGSTTCYANCDGSTQPPILNVADFSCFLTKFAAGDAYANCDGSTVPPVLNVADFSCFLGKFAAGCP
jgi:murein tripeptide amidase MpaA